MLFYIIVAVVVIVALFLIYGRLYKLIKILEQYFNIQNMKNNKFDDDLFCELIGFRNLLEEIEEKIAELTDFSTIDNPAWGKDSAYERKKSNLARLYANYLMQQKNMTDEDALCKSTFVINKFGIKAVIRDMRSRIQSEDKAKSEENFLSSGFFKRKIEEKAKSLGPIEVFEPLYLGIMIKNYEKGTSLVQRSAKDGYEEFIKDTAIIYKLEELGLFKKDTESGLIRGYILTETDLDLIGSVIFKDLKDSDYYAESLEMRHEVV